MKDWLSTLSALALVTGYIAFCFAVMQCAITNTEKHRLIIDEKRQKTFDLWQRTEGNPFNLTAEEWHLARLNSIRTNLPTK